MMERGVVSAYKILEMKELPDAIFAVNDPVAIGAMKTLQKHGLKIPEDIAITSFSDSQKALIVEPNLTSVEQPTFEMGKIAAELLLKQIKHNHKNEDRILSQSIILDAKLNIRESSLRDIK
jgi:LacI family transcriptional regulator